MAQAGNDVIHIAPDGDLTVLLNADNKITRYRVDRSTMLKYSRHFKASLDGRFKESQSDIINLFDDKIDGLEMFLRALHDNLADYQDELGAEDPVWWYIVMACDKYEIDVRDGTNAITKRIRAFFSTCYNQQMSPHQYTLNIKIARQLLFPTFIFDCASGFQHVTEYLAYNVDRHITELNPTEHYQLHLPHRVINQLNAARGRLRTVLYAGIFDPIAGRFHASCKCKAETTHNYEKTLIDLEVWPMHPWGFKDSIHTLLHCLRKFEYDPLCGRDAADVCMGCMHGDYKASVMQITEKVTCYFDGLCLDCMDRSKHKTRDEDQDYWSHHSHGILRKFGRSDGGCRISHGNPTWYHSFMGREEKKNVV
ncbi:hypothetical protein NA57DRAFT_54866 [Rhizodiscina lignyota]|uniref:BTB domain-containing protein n=1 Tax=Rhizodiscina lignyota TaxID=1504668 RepID=A0A9P4MCM0_9PEZI|nr:hypothetical protein NA57DRAFT_54866 [Rhizodiscina lignyota]